MPKAALYLRVSTAEQTIENQREPLESMARARGHVVAEIVEEVESGAKKRPKLDELCRRSARGEFAAVLCWSVDRLGRSMPDIVERVRRLDAAGVAVISYQEPWLAVDGPSRELLLSIFAWVSQFERERLRERTRAGLERARRAGKRLGQVPASRGAVDLARAAVARGESISAAARASGLSRSTVRAYLAANVSQ